MSYQRKHVCGKDLPEGSKKMNILNKNHNEIINTDNLIEIKIVKEYGDDKEINVVKCSHIIGMGVSFSVTLGTYEAEDRAKEILLDIYSKLNENKSSYGMPTE